jgi:hypothetical protein
MILLRTFFSPSVGTVGGWGTCTNTVITTMPNRRKVLLGIGSLAAGSAAAMGTGAFTSASAERSVTVETAGDESAYLGLEAGSSEGVDEYVSGTDGGELTIDLSSNGEGDGVNMGAVTTIGDVDEYESEYAFAVTNNGTQGVNLYLDYDFEDASWIETGPYDASDQSFIEFEARGDGLVPPNPGAPWGYSANFPPQSTDGFNQAETEEQQIYGGNNYKTLDAGTTWYFIIRVDTTGEDAQMSDDLSGTLTIKAEDADN